MVIYATWIAACPPADFSDEITVSKKTIGPDEDAVHYVVANYVREKVTPAFAHYRSVVYSEPSLRMVSFSPPKSVPLFEFRKRYPRLDDEEFLVTETIEGTMVSLFYNPEPGVCKWEIATKSSVGGAYHYFRTDYFADPKAPCKTFRSMFVEALTPDGTEVCDLNDLPLLAGLSRTYSYTFVLQHPANHIVLYHPRPRAVLVAVYSLDPARSLAANVPQSEYSGWSMFAGGVVKFPEMYKDWSYERLEDDISVARNAQTRVGEMMRMGVSITRLCTGERTKIENPVYLDLHELRGNHPNLQYHYICLARIGKAGDFARHFPSYASYFSRFAQQYARFAKGLRAAYLAKYVLKDGGTLPDKFRRHADRLHYDVYVPSLAPGAPGGRRIITAQVVNAYLAGLDPGVLMKSLNTSSEEV